MTRILIPFAVTNGTTTSTRFAVAERLSNGDYVLLRRNGAAYPATFLSAADYAVEKAGSSLLRATASTLPGAAVEAKTAAIPAAALAEIEASMKNTAWRVNPDQTGAWAEAQRIEAAREGRFEAAARAVDARRARMAARLGQAPAAAGDTAPAPSPAPEVGALMAQIAGLQAQIREMQMAAEMAALRAEVDALKAQLAEEDSAGQELERIVEQARQEALDATAQTKAALAEAAQTKAALAGSQEALARLQAELDEATRPAAGGKKR
jgi:regulator of replication initiation timing